ncbi:NAD-dependent epimerase/dehydratase family protein [Parasphingopyxis lamellibrachiae]|uniref:Nucleoside-diphosphate-sugar epimerase n=1 Tax=Parasphingopyxis lamellibrachiae TaxID=680125 RepID=A0A3D9FIY9_9SPHN|nr:NAD-dependent epimerase/dehydratase family protein [Parasphingopyxis lamellibrachiae]RED17750.1 nucleoside-diphosphate-sugar epimerase [Parasphingopyxis lamellibrachiae]
MPGTVLVTGGSGYIAGFTIRQLVAEGWTVHSTIRSLDREQQVRDILNVDNAKLRFFAADLMDDAGWAEAMAGCTHLAHLASPLPSASPRDENDLIGPARDGALRALRFAKEAGVKRVVMTSSMAAIAYGVDRGEYTFSEKDWTNLEHPDVYPYVKSKTISERAARDWMVANGEGMEFCTINPSMVLGPILSPDFSTSLEAVKKMMDGSFPGAPDLGFCVVDVRDVADLHVRALTAPDMDGERFFAAGKFFKLHDIAMLLKERLGDEAKKVPSRKLPDWLMKIVAIWDPVARQVKSELGKVRHADASHAKEKLGWQTRDEEQTIVDTARSLIDNGIVKT